ISLLPASARSFFNRYWNENNVANKLMKETTTKCQCIGHFSATIKVEKPTPAIPPELHRPWKAPMILFSKCFWRVNAWVLIEMFKIRRLNENKPIDKMRVKVVFAKPIKESAIALETNAPVSGILLSKRDTSQPDMGRPIRELIGIARRIEPN